ncbi:MAG: glycoside hydrolase [Actinobacteria bacterium]|nr:glycoside hydrolase [Actinomycetota bacterium]
MRKMPAVLALVLALLLMVPAAGRAQQRGAQGTRAAAPVTFFPNVELTCDLEIAGGIGCGQLLEPEAKSAPDGTIWVTAQEGAGAGVNVWIRDPKTFVYRHLAKVDGDPVGVTRETGLTPGGGDNDLSISTDGGIQISTLNSLATIGMAVSDSGGEDFEYNPQSSNFVGVDRQWQTAYGPDTVYLAYHDIDIVQVWMVKSTDGGRTFGPPQPMLPADQAPTWGGGPAPGMGTGNIHSNLITDKDGRAAFAYLQTSSPTANFTPQNRPNTVWVSITDPDGANPEVHQVYAGPEDANLQGLFPAIAADRAGNLYVTWSNLNGVYMSSSRDHGVKWSAPIKVSSGKENTSTVFPFVIAGDAGRVGLAWLGSTAATPSNATDTTSKWKTYYSYNLNALKKGSKWTQVVASDHVVHTGEICLDGLLCDATLRNRNLAEVLQIGLTKDGRALIAYPDDSSDAHFAGWSWIAEQNSGPGLYANVKPNPPKLPPPAAIHGGVLPNTVKVRKAGNATAYFVPGESSGTGFPNPDPAGGEIDAPGDAGLIANRAGNELHVASGNLWTTNFGGLPVVFDGPVVKRDTVVGGKTSLTAFLQEPSAEAAIGTITAQLLDVAPDGTSTLIAGGGDGYDAGVEIHEHTYSFKTKKPYEVLKGHHLRVSINFTCFCSSTLRFYYGSAEYPARFTYEKFVRG